MAPPNSSSSAPTPAVSTLVPSYIPTMLRLALHNAPADERSQFLALCQHHQQLLNQTGKVIYFLPRGMGMRMGLQVLHNIADNLSAQIGTNVFVHFGINQLVYRIGQVGDQQDLNDTVGLSMLYCAHYTPPVFAPISPPAQTISATPVNAEKVPKPRNKWILYRQSKHQEIVEKHPGMHTSEISKVIGAMWRKERPSVIFHFEKLAAAEKAAHLLKYPGYRARNRRPSEIKRRTKNVTHINVTKPIREHEQLTAAELNIMLGEAVQQHVPNAPSPFQPEEQDLLTQSEIDFEALQSKVMAESEELLNEIETATKDNSQQLDVGSENNFDIRSLSTKPSSCTVLF